MAAKSAYLAKKNLDHNLRNVAYTPATTWFLALYTSNPTGADSGTEVSGSGYARQAITFVAASGSSSGITENVADVTFPQATADYPAPVTHWGIRDASSGGNLLYYGAFTPAKTITLGITPAVAAGAIDLTET